MSGAYDWKTDTENRDKNVQHANARIYIEHADCLPLPLIAFVLVEESVERSCARILELWCAQGNQIFPKELWSSCPH